MSSRADSQTIDRVSFMLSIDNEVRIDVAMTPERVYYRFATEDTMEDGELPGGKDPKAFDDFARELVGVFTAGVNASAPIDPIRFTLFINNIKVTPEVLNKTTLRKFIDIASSTADELQYALGALRP